MIRFKRLNQIERKDVLCPSILNANELTDEILMSVISSIKNN